MLQPRVHADGLANVFAGLVPQVYQVIVLVVLPFELPGGVDEEKRTGQMNRHGFHDRLELRAAGDQVLPFRFRLLDQLLVREAAPDQDKIGCTSALERCKKAGSFLTLLSSVLNPLLTGVGGR
jgi:hypothetical protein